MNVNKWNEIDRDEKDEFMRVCNKLGFAYTPQNWPKVKAGLQKYISEMDKATEVYNMENGVNNLVKKGYME